LKHWGIFTSMRSTMTRNASDTSRSSGNSFDLQHLLRASAQEIHPWGNLKPQDNGPH